MFFKVFTNASNKKTGLPFRIVIKVYHSKYPLSSLNPLFSESAFF